MRTALPASLATLALAVSAAAFVALQLAASRAVGETGLGSQKGVTRRSCGGRGHYTEEALRRWHVLTVKTYHIETPGRPNCAHEWERSGGGGDACGAIPRYPFWLVDLSLGLVAWPLMLLAILGFRWLAGPGHGASSPGSGSTPWATWSWTWRDARPSSLRGIDSSGPHDGDGSPSRPRGTAALLWRGADPPGANDGGGSP